MKLVSIISVVLFILAGCALNNVYLHPFEVNPDKLNYFDEDLGKRVYATEGENYQPFFHDSLNKAVDLNFNVESVLFPNRKGDTIHGWFMEPKSNSKDVMLYYLHGNAGNIYYQYSLMVPFVERGYTVFMIDYSGFGHSQGKAKRKFVYTDAEDGFAYLKSREDKKKSKLIVYGQSLGGHLTAAYAPSIANEIDGVVIEGAFTSHKDIAAESTGLGWFAKMWIREGYSGKDSIPNLTKPFMVVHSTEDATIPYWMGEEFNTLANSPKTFITIDGRHVFGPILHSDTIFNSMERMIGN